MGGLILILIVYYTLISAHSDFMRLMNGSRQRLLTAFRPKTRKCYTLLLRNFVGFCQCSKISLQEISIDIILAYLEYLVENKVSMAMIANNISAIKANLTLYGLEYSILDHPRVHYFMKAIRINRRLSIPKCNIMSIKDLEWLSALCDQFACGPVFRAVFLLAFFAFLRISNVTPSC